MDEVNQRAMFIAINRGSSPPPSMVVATSDRVLRLDWKADQAGVHSWLVAGIGTADFTTPIDILERRDLMVSCCSVLDGVAFDRTFAEPGLSRDMVRLSPLLDENMLLAGGALAAEGLYSGMVPSSGSVARGWTKRSECLP